MDQIYILTFWLWRILLWFHSNGKFGCINFHFQHCLPLLQTINDIRTLGELLRVEFKSRQMSLRFIFPIGILLNAFIHTYRDKCMHEYNRTIKCMSMFAFTFTSPFCIANIFMVNVMHLLAYHNVFSFFFFIL